MPRRLPKYCREYRDRHGKLRIEYRRKGERTVRLHGLPWTPEFMAQYERALAGDQHGPLANSNGKIVPGTWRWLCIQYFQSADFLRLSDRTRIVRRRILEATCEEPVSPGSPITFADFPISKMTRKAIKVLRDRKMEKPEAANGRLKAIRQVFAYGLEEQDRYVTDDPSRGVRFFKSSTTGFHTWTRDEVDQFLGFHGLESKAALALNILLYTGVRRSDAVRLGWDMLEEGIISFKARKTRHITADLVHIPLLPALAEVLGSPTAGLGGTFLLTEHGKPYSPEGFGNRFKAWCVQAGLLHCSAHGLRKAGATFAAENGATESHLRAIYGWSSAKMPALYTRQAQRKLLAQSGMSFIHLGRSAMSASAKTSEQVSNPEHGLDTSDEIPSEISSVLKGMVPRDRIELPTRGFSIHCSTD